MSDISIIEFDSVTVSLIENIRSTPEVQYFIKPSNVDFYDWYNLSEWI